MYSSEDFKVSMKGFQVLQRWVLMVLASYTCFQIIAPPLLPNELSNTGVRSPLEIHRLNFHTKYSLCRHRYHQMPATIHLYHN